MPIFRTFRVLGLVAGLLFVSQAISEGAISLRVNGADTSSVTLNPGQSCTIEIFSNNSIEYVAYVGFLQGVDSLGTFDYLYANPQAGTFAMVNPFNQPPFSYAYEAAALGGPSPGFHFAFQYIATTPGQAELGLWDSTIHKVDAVSITVTVMAAQELGACCDYGIDCYMSTQQQCVPQYYWLGPDTDCSMCGIGFCCEPDGSCYPASPGGCPGGWAPDCALCPQPQGACCNEMTGECFISGPGGCPYTWLGQGTDCSMCVPQPQVVIKRFEINQCFQEVEADGLTQKYDLIETKPFVVDVNLGTELEEPIKVNKVELKISKGDTLIVSKSPYKEKYPIEIKKDKQKKCVFYFIDNETKDMKAGEYKFSLVVEDAKGNKLLEKTLPYMFKSSKPVRILAAGSPQLIFFDKKYFKFVEKVFPVPKRNTAVNCLKVISYKLSTSDLSYSSVFDKLCANMEKTLKDYNDNHKEQKADSICAVVPAGVLPDSNWAGVAVGSAVFITQRADSQYVLGHETGHIYELGEEYIDSKTKNAVGLWVLDQTFRFDLNPPPLKLDPNGLFCIVREPYLGQRCNWDPDQSSYAPRIEPADSRKCNGRFVVPDKAGYDVIDKREVRFNPSNPNNNTLTMMSSVSGSNWISGPEYKSLIAALAPTAPKSKATASPASAAPLTLGQRMLVSGIVDMPARTAEISPLMPVPNLEVSQEASDPNCRLVFKSSTQAVLGDFNLAPLESELPGSQLKGPFSVIVDLPAGTARVQVNIYGVVADELLLTANSPIVSVLSPNGGEQISGEMLITWSASDADSNDLNDLSYTVKFSHDNGTEWSALVMDHDVNELIVDSNYLPGGPNCLVKVIASDGWNRAEDVSNSVFSITTKPPEVTILDPEDGTILLSSESMQGRCTAYDPETGDINDPNAVVWSSNIDGFLGKGDLVGFELSVGEHILSATATDPEAKTGIDTVSVKVLANASDFNCDIRVDFLDLSKFAEKWQATCSSPNWCEGTDIDHSGVVDYDDFAELVENWLWPAD